MDFLIIDDEVEACRNLQNIISNYIKGDINIVGWAHDTNTAEQKIALFKPDAVFLDIDMPNENAFSFLERIQPFNFEIIFVTAYDAYAVKAFKLNAIDYVLKPINIEDLKNAIGKVADRISVGAVIRQYNQQYENVVAGYKAPATGQHLVLRDNNNYEIVPFSDVLYIEAKGSYSKVVFNKGKEEFAIVMSLPIAEYEEMLPENLFFRIHRSFLVNKFAVARIIREEHVAVTLKSGAVLPVSRRRQAGTFSFFK